jgi:putative DNA primase/helicase
VRRFGEFLALQIPPRQAILAPWLSEKSLCLIHAARGVGKTHMVIGIAMAVASGGKFLKWKAPAPRRVVVLDGEMPMRTLQERFQDAAVSFPQVLDENLLIIASDDQEDRAMPDIATARGQAEVTELLRPGDLLILDNISTLCRTGVENEAESWAPVQGWLLDLRRAGVSVLLIGHDGKNGTNRGSSKKEDVLDVVIQLKNPPGHKAEDGAHFEVLFQKSRGLLGTDVEPFEARLETVDGTLGWGVIERETATVKRVAELITEGLSHRDIEKELGIPISTISRARRKAREAGLLKE